MTSNELVEMSKHVNNDDLFKIEAGSKTPEVILNFKDGTGSIVGLSLPENAITIYQKVIDEIERFKNSENDIITINLNFKYINSSSSKSLYMVFRVLKKLDLYNKSIVANWTYDGDDESVEDVVEVITADLDITMNLIIEEDED